MTDVESRGGRNVCIIGSDVADALFPNQTPIDKTVLIGGSPFRVVGVYDKQGSFLGLFSLDNVAVVPLAAFQKAFSNRLYTSIPGKGKGKGPMDMARGLLTGDSRPGRGLAPDV